MKTPFKVQGTVFKFTVSQLLFLTTFHDCSMSKGRDVKKGNLFMTGSNCFVTKIL